MGIRFNGSGWDPDIGILLTVINLQVLQDQQDQLDK
jgi:hypothetical protein